MNSLKTIFFLFSLLSLISCHPHNGSSSKKPKDSQDVVLKRSNALAKLSHFDGSGKLLEYTNYIYDDSDPSYTKEERYSLGDQETMEIVERYEYKKDLSQTWKINEKHELALYSKSEQKKYQEDDFQVEESLYSYWDLETGKEESESKTKYFYNGEIDYRKKAKVEYYYKSKYSDKENTDFSSITYSYNEEGKLSESMEYENNVKSKTTKTSYIDKTHKDKEETFDAKDNLIKSHVYDWKNLFDLTTTYENGKEISHHKTRYYKVKDSSYDDYESYFALPIEEESVSSYSKYHKTCEINNTDIVCTEEDKTTADKLTSKTTTKGSLDEYYWATTNEETKEEYNDKGEITLKTIEKNEYNGDGDKTLEQLIVEINNKGYGIESKTIKYTYDDTSKNKIKTETFDKDDNLITYDVYEYK